MKSDIRYIKNAIILIYLYDTPIHHIVHPFNIRLQRSLILQELFEFPANYENEVITRLFNETEAKKTRGLQTERIHLQIIFLCKCFDRFWNVQCVFIRTLRELSKLSVRSTMVSVTFALYRPMVYSVCLMMLLRSTLIQSSNIWAEISGLWTTDLAAWHRWFREIWRRSTWANRRATVKAKQSGQKPNHAIDRQQLLLS